MVGEPQNRVQEDGIGLEFFVTMKWKKNRLRIMSQDEGDFLNGEDKGVK